MVIGINVYNIVKPNLTFAKPDAISLTSLLSTTGWTVDATLVDGQATKEGIRKAIASLAAEVGSDSTVLVYYSGHGVSLSGQAYIAPCDTHSNLSPDSLISMPEINAWVNAIPCANRLLILDSCYSGGFVDTASSIDTAPQNYGPYDNGTEAAFLPTVLGNAGGLLAKAMSQGSDPSILTISAAGSEEQSYDGDRSPDGIASGHGAFTYFLLQAGSASAADTDGNKLVTAVEAYGYAKDQLKKTWNAKYWSTPDGSMYMDFLPHISGGSGDIVLYDRR